MTSRALVLVRLVGAMTLKLLIDTDPGVDDTIALLLALGSRDLQVVGITTIFGNTDTETATRNALHLLELGGWSGIPVARGSAWPLGGEQPVYASHVHGLNGMGDVPIPPPRMEPSSLSAAELIVRTVMDAPGEITLVTLGPLTNIALALELEPRLGQNVASVVVMGGALDVPGNVSPTAEANIFNDPLAAERVLGTDWPLTLVGLDVTKRVVMTPDYLRMFRHPDFPLGEHLWRISRIYEDFHERRYGFRGLYAHDPAALAFVLAPSLFTTERTGVRVLTSGPERGRTVRSPREDPGPSRVCVGVDATGVLELIRSHLLPR